MTETNAREAPGRDKQVFTITVYAPRTTEPKVFERS